MNSNAALDRRKKQAPEGPQAGIDDKKGKNKAKGSSSTGVGGADPLEIAYGPTIGTHKEITEDDFNVDVESGLHKPQDHEFVEPHPTPPPREDDESPINEERGQWERSDGDGADDSHKSPQYATGSEEEFQNVWGR